MHICFYLGMILILHSITSMSPRFLLYEVLCSISIGEMITEVGSQLLDIAVFENLNLIFFLCSAIERN